MNNVKVNFNSEFKFREFGANNGPRPTNRHNLGEKLYQELDFSFSRLHDTGIAGFHKYVDINKIFKDFSKDENDLNNYNFKDTDKYVNKLLSLNKEIIFRLGYSASIIKIKYNKVPSNIEKWSVIAFNIAKHYEGKIKFFEIWNEPDLKIFFDGSIDEILKIYEKTATKIKNGVKNSLVGGMAFCNATSIMAIKFLEYVKEKNLPLDFFSYHRYHYDPYEFSKLGYKIRNLLDSYGFNKTITILDEWNMMFNFNEQQKYSYKVMRTDQGAAWLLSTLIEIAQAPIDINTYYDFQISYMLFLYNPLLKFGPLPILKKGKPFNSYLVFNTLKKVGVYSSSTSDTKGLHSLASFDKKNKVAYLLLNNYKFTDQRDYEIKVDIGDFKYKGVSITSNKETLNYEKLPDVITLKYKEYKLIKFYL